MSAISDNHAAIAGEFTRLVHGVRDWDAPTPVKEWRARDVVGHLTSWLPGFLHGLEVHFPDAADGTADPVGVWPGFSDQVQALLEDPERASQLVTPPGGGPDQQPLDELLTSFYVSDVLMHSWDLAKASGQEPRLDPQMVTDLVSGMTKISDTLAASGQFGTPVVLDETHPTLDRLIAIIGRDPHWQVATQD